MTNPILHRLGRGVLLTALLLGSAARSLAGGLPDGEVVNRVVIPFRAGNITRVIMTEKSVSWIQLDPALLAGKFAANEPIPSAQMERTPAEGSIFLILFVQLAAKHSIGRYDYAIECGTETAECLAIAGRDDPFDPRRYQLLDDGSGGDVRLLYQIRCPTRSTEGILRPKLQRTLREVEVDIPLELPVPDAPKVEPNPAAEPGDGAAAAPAEGQAEPAAAAGEPAAEKPAEQPQATAPVEKPAEKPAAKPAEKPAAKPAGKPAEKPEAKPAEKPAGKPAAKPDEKPAEKPAAKPAEKPAEKPAPPKPVDGGSLWD